MIESWRYKAVTAKRNFHIIFETAPCICDFDKEDPL